VRRWKVGPESFVRGITNKCDPILMVRQIQVVDLGEIGVLGGHPEEWETGDLPVQLDLAGQLQCRKSLVQGVKRPPEESYLLAGDHGDGLRIAQARDALKECIIRPPGPVLVGENDGQLVPGISPPGEGFEQSVLRFTRVPSIEIADERRPVQIIPKNGIDPSKEGDVDSAEAKRGHHGELGWIRSLAFSLGNLRA
jgi:hypothetical protein